MPTGLLDFLETSLDFLVAGNVADFFCTIDDLLEWLISDNFSLLLVICLCMEEVQYILAAGEVGDFKDLNK